MTLRHEPIRLDGVEPVTYAGSSMSGPSEVLGDDDDWSLPDLTERSVAPNLIAVPRLRFVVDREAGKPVERVVDLDGDRLRIGSHPSNELVLQDRRVSRFHCVLSLEDGVWRVTDTGALNGTSLSGVRVRDAILPCAHCELTLGDSTLQIAQLQPEKLSPIPDANLTGPFKVAKERLIAQFERAYLERLMTAAAGNVSLASRMAKLDRMYLYRLLQRHAIARDATAAEASMRRSIER